MVRPTRSDTGLGDTLRGADAEFSRCGFPNEGKDVSEDTAGAVINREGDGATIWLNAKAVAENMQKDPAAFEVWALALLRHCGAKHVLIDADVNAAVGDWHRNRFQYRLSRLCDLGFPIRMKPEKLHWEGAALPPDVARWVLNTPDDRPFPLPKGNAWEAMCLAEGVDEGNERKRGKDEKIVEWGLEASTAFHNYFDLRTVARQWQVGLFKNHKADGTRHFPSGAIDLIGLRGDTLYLFELKTKENTKAGSLSEIFFYSAVMRDALRRQFEFASAATPKNCAIAPSDVTRCRNIVSVLLHDNKHHPLIADQRLIRSLNDAIAGHWRDIPVRFETARITRRPTSFSEDFAFSP